MIGSASASWSAHGRFGVGAEAHHPEADARDAQARAAEVHVLHSNLLSTGCASNLSLRLHGSSPGSCKFPEVTDRRDREDWGEPVSDDADDWFATPAVEPSDLPTEASWQDEPEPLPPRRQPPPEGLGRRQALVVLAAIGAVAIGGAGILLARSLGGSDGGGETDTIVASTLQTATTATTASTPTTTSSTTTETTTTTTTPTTPSEVPFRRARRFGRGAREPR